MTRTVMHVINVVFIAVYAAAFVYFTAGGQTWWQGFWASTFLGWTWHVIGHELEPHLDRFAVWCREMGEWCEAEAKRLEEEDRRRA